MRIDIFRRKEKDNRYSWLIVPEGKLIPAEAANTDWEAVDRGVDLNLDTQSLDDLSIIYPARQIQEKGYAISESYELSGTGRHII
ncbi:MAG: DUF6139 family protein [Burkholderiaceae bacterium]|jgi:hypothetical protein|nr:DUF6139 family protein [Burkholderiaceae bacterium]